MMTITFIQICEDMVKIPLYVFLPNHCCLILTLINVLRLLAHIHVEKRLSQGCV